jgi:hypothetical protein
METMKGNRTIKCKTRQRKKGTKRKETKNEERKRD